MNLKKAATPAKPDTSTQSTGNPSTIRPVSRTISQHCAAYNMSRTTFYKLKKLGLAPRTINTGRKNIIPSAFEDEWLEKMAALQDAPKSQPTVDEILEGVK